MSDHPEHMAECSNEAVDEFGEFFDRFLQKHTYQAVPVIIGCCAFWAVDNGAEPIMRRSLLSALMLVEELAAKRKEMAQ